MCALDPCAEPRSHWLLHVAEVGRKSLLGGLSATGREGFVRTFLEALSLFSKHLARSKTLYFFACSFPFVLRRGDRFGMTSHSSRSVHACLETARLRELRVAENGRSPARPLLRRKPQFRRRSVHEGYVCSHCGEHASGVRFSGICARRRASEFFG